MSAVIFVKIISGCLVVLSVLFPISYKKIFRKREWISYYDAEEYELMKDYGNDGKIIIIYTFVGAIIRSVGLAGVVNLIMLLTAEWLWIPIVQQMTLGLIWMFFMNRFGFSAFIGMVVGILYYREIRGRIRGWI